MHMYVSNLLECNMRPLITKPTKVNLNNQTTRFSILDQIWVTEDFQNVQSYILPLGITDHFPVCMVVSSLAESSVPIKLKKILHLKLSDSNQT